MPPMPERALVAEQGLDLILHGDRTGLEAAGLAHHEEHEVTDTSVCPVELSLEMS